MALFIWFLTNDACAQFKMENGKIEINADTMTVRQAFAFMRFALPMDTKYIMVVKKDSVTYWQTNYVVNRMLKGWAYTKKNRRTKLVRI